MIQETVVQTFIENVKKSAAEVTTVDSVQALNDAIAAIMQEPGTIYKSSITTLENSIRVDENRLSDDFVNARYSIDEVDAGIAETGTVISTSKRGRKVQTNLLPTHHIAIISEKNIFSEVTDYLASVASAPPTNITFETGPSRTADIELTLTIGVHGPEKLTVIVYSGQDLSQ